MRVLFTFCSAALLTSAAVLVAACSSTVTGNGTPSQSTPDGGPSNVPGTDSGPSTNEDGSTTTTNPPASTTPGNVDIGNACATFTACAGAPQGTYDYHAGCIGDALAAAKAQCPALDASNAKATVTGSLYFEGNALSRDAVSHISGSIVVPASCSQGQCAAVQTALSGGFDTVTCTGATDCTCVISKTTTVKNATTFTVSGETLTTADGDSYSICAKPTGLDYTGKSLGAEDGAWNLTKR